MYFPLQTKTAFAEKASTDSLRRGIGEGFVSKVWLFIKFYQLP